MKESTNHLEEKLSLVQQELSDMETKCHEKHVENRGLERQINELKRENNIYRKRCSDHEAAVMAASNSPNFTPPGKPSSEKGSIKKNGRRGSLGSNKSSKLDHM